jgi:nickel/cobalt transporter (NiCoT) family protein
MVGAARGTGRARPLRANGDHAIWRRRASRGVPFSMPIYDQFGGQLSGLRRRIAGLYALLIAANLGAWVWAALLFRQQPMLLGTALLAYGFGLRHAVDADHIAAIDNVTRKLIEEGKRPVGIGFYFAVGHSTVVVLAAAAVAAATAAMTGRFASLEAIGGVVGTGISSLFLLAVAAMNCLILHHVWRTYRHVRAGGAYRDEDFDVLLRRRGLFARLFRPLFRIIGASWHMAPLGFLFGLGFDTATEVALLGISATMAARDVSIWAIMVFPVLFAAGMSLVDTTDGVLMLGAYDWAFVKPIRKLFYNLVITLVSVVVAVLIGGIEALGLLADRLDLGGRFWGVVGALNASFSALGVAVIGIFMLAWIGSVLIYRYSGLDEVEVRQAKD